MAKSEKKVVYIEDGRRFTHSVNEDINPWLRQELYSEGWSVSKQEYYPEERLIQDPYIQNLITQTQFRAYQHVRASFLKNPQAWFKLLTKEQRENLIVLHDQIESTK